MKPASNKNRILLLIIAVLLATNIAGVAYYFWAAKKSPHAMAHKGMDRKTFLSGYLKDSLQFTPQQLQQFDSVSQKNIEASTPLFESLRVEKEKRMKFLIEHDFTDSALTEAVTRSSIRQMALDREMLAYFKDIRLICNPEQKQKFDTGFFKMMGRGHGKKKSK